MRYTDRVCCAGLVSSGQRPVLYWLRSLCLHWDVARSEILSSMMLLRERDSVRDSVGSWSLLRLLSVVVRDGRSLWWMDRYLLMHVWSNVYLLGLRKI